MVILGQNKDRLRIAYAGSVQIISQFSSLFTGLLFVTIVTRNLTVAEFGLWQVLGSVLGLALLPLAPIYYWNVRQVARNQDVGKTALLSGFIVLPFMLMIYFAIAPTLSPEFFIVLLFSIQIPFFASVDVMRGTAQSSRPQILGYVAIVFEVGKVVSIFFLISFFNLGLAGAILSLVIAPAIQMGVIAYAIRDRIRGNFQFSVLKSWFRTSWIPFLTSAYGRIYYSDAILVAFVLSSTVLVGFFQAARTFYVIIGFSETFTRVLYPKLLRDRLGGDITLSLRLQTLFQVPLVVGTFALAEPLLAILNTEYVAAAFILRLLVVVAIIQSIERVMDFVLLGSESADATDLRFDKLKSSWLVKLPLVDIIKGITYLTLLFVALQVDTGIITLGIFWALVMITVFVPFTIYKVIVAKRQMSFNFPIRSMTKYTFAGIVMLSFLFLYRNSYPWVDTTLVGTLSYLIIPSFVSVALYGIITLAVDPFTRDLVRRVVKIVIKK